jgi:hypothetical protein
VRIKLSYRSISDLYENRWKQPIIKLMNVYQIAGKQCAVAGEELYEQFEPGTIGARPTDLLTDLAPAAPELPLPRKSI